MPESNSSTAGVDRVLAAGQMIEVNVGRGEARMPKQALQLLQGISQGRRR